VATGANRYLTQQGDDGWVVAPSWRPQQAGARVKPARREAVHLARWARSGDLTAVDVPQVEAAAMRDLPRARAETSSNRKAAKCRRHAVVLRPAIRSGGRATGGPAPLRWRSAVGCPTPAQQSVFQAEVHAVSEHTERLQRLAPARPDHVHAWRMYPAVEARQVWRGVPCTGASPG
jgi:transposase